jgi:uncharacterized protein YerC
MQHNLLINHNASEIYRERDRRNIFAFSRDLLNIAHAKQLQDFLSIVIMVKTIRYR